MNAQFSGTVFIIGLPSESSLAVKSLVKIMYLILSCTTEVFNHPEVL